MSAGGLTLDLDALGPYLRELRLAGGWTQAEAGEAAGMSRSTVSRIERSDYSVRVSRHTALGAALGFEFHFTLAPRAAA